MNKANYKWEKEFNKIIYFNRPDDYYKALKFISTLLQEQKKEVIEKIEEIINKNTSSGVYSPDGISEDLIEFLQSLKEEKK